MSQMSPLEISASAIGSAAKAWLASPCEVQILHVFDRVCNLINEHKEVLSIVTPQIGNGPFNLVVDSRVLFPEYLTTESQIIILNNQLMLGDLTIHLADARLWNPYPDWVMLHAKRNDILNSLIHFEFASPIGLATMLQIPDYQSLLSSLLTALANANISSALTSASKLAGLGAGLTPAGDDFIMGAIYAAWIIHPLEVAGVLAREIANTAAPRTTSLSAAWLRSAEKGEAGILWHKLFDALISSDAAAIQSRINKLLSVGQTSGTDALSGFMNLFRCWADEGAGFAVS